MKSTTLNLAVAVLLLAAGSASAAAPAGPAEPPKVFNDLGVTMQSRVCGELMAGLALGGVQALQMQLPGGVVPPAQRQPVYDTSAKAVVLLAMSGSLKLDDRLKAGEVAQAIEKMDPKAHVDTAMFCQRRVEAWIRAGQVDKDLVLKASSQAKALMDTAFNSSSADNGDR
jgi:hypothetical protein